MPNWDAIFSSIGLKTNPAAYDSDIDSITVLPPWGTNTWAQGAAPGANAQATTTKAAAGAGFRHVCTGITASFVGDGAGAPSAVDVLALLRDGTTGTGTILWAAGFALPAVAGSPGFSLALSGLTIRGTENTAMTLEFTAAGGANTVEVVGLQGATEAV